MKTLFARKTWSGCPFPESAGWPRMELWRAGNSSVARATATSKFWESRDRDTIDPWPGHGAWQVRFALEISRHLEDRAHSPSATRIASWRVGAETGRGCRGSRDSISPVNATAFPFAETGADSGRGCCRRRRFLSGLTARSSVADRHSPGAASEGCRAIPAMPPTRMARISVLPVVNAEVIRGPFLTQRHRQRRPLTVRASVFGKASCPVRYRRSGSDTPDGLPAALLPLQSAPSADGSGVGVVPEIPAVETPEPDQVGTRVFATI